MEKHEKIYVAGHRGLVGSALCRLLYAQGFTSIVTRDFLELDLRNQDAVRNFFERERPAYVFLAAAKVGGIKANNEQRAEFIYDNLMIQTNVIHQSYIHDVKKLLFLGSSCIYPRDCIQPIREEYLLTGLLEKTNEPYAIAKIAGIKMIEAYRAQYGCNFISAMPTNLYGPGDTFDLNQSHVIPALLLKFHQAYQNTLPYVSLWGTGAALREFLFVEDCADALITLMKNYNEAEFINVASGQEITIKDLAHLIKDVVGYQGDIIFNQSYSDGTPRKRLNLDKLAMINWRSTTSLRHGLEKTYEWFKKTNNAIDETQLLEKSTSHLQCQQ